MQRALPHLLAVSLILFFSAIVLNKFQNASAAAATNIVISEIQVAGVNPTDDFIELYNPTSSEIDLKDYRLVKVTGSGTDDDGVVAFENGDVIPAHGYFLWCNTNLATTLNCDSATSGSIANNNSIGLRNGALNTGILVDSVTFGTVTNSLGESLSLTAPTASTSVERKANASSTNVSMAVGGIDEFMGNAEDTNNNSSDFVARPLPQPQNNASPIEPIGAPSASPSLSPAPTATLTPTNTPSPTVFISPTLTVTNTPSVTATTTPSVSPTSTLTPTVTTPATITPTPSLKPSVSPTPPAPTPKVIFSGPRFTCAIHYRPLKFFNKIIFIPFGHCTYY